MTCPRCGTEGCPTTWLPNGYPLTGSDRIAADRACTERMIERHLAAIADVITNAAGFVDKQGTSRRFFRTSDRGSR